MNHKISRTIFAVIFVALLFNAARAQQLAAVQQPAEGRIALYQALLDLQNPWTVMCVAAHPDDEDGTSLIVMRHKFGAHTVSLFSTFGEGGQNAIGPELYEELGAIRARETMAAAEIQGSEPHFLGLKDFGYSKTRDEAFKFWGHEEGLRRMVLEIRKLRPDVIITNHSTASNDHGQHQATALMVVEAFDAAADPNKFPEQLKDGVTTWQVQRLFVRVRGNQAPAADTQIVSIDPNERDPVRGTVFAEQALAGLQKHATQGPWPKTFAEFTARFRAFSGQGGQTGQMPLIRYALVKTAKDAAPMSTQQSHNFLDGLALKDEALQRLTSLMMSDPPLLTAENVITLLDDKDVFSKLSGIAKEFHHVSTPRMSIPRTVNVRDDLMNERLNTALAAAAGIEVSVAAEGDAVVPVTPARFVITVTNHGNKEARLYSITLAGMAIGAAQPPEKSLVGPGQSVRIIRTFDTPQTTNVTVPHARHLDDGRVFGETFTAIVPMTIQGSPLQITKTTAIDVVPPIEIARITPSPAAVTPEKADNRSQKIRVPFEVALINHRDVAFDGRLAALDAVFGNPINDMPVKLAASEKQTVRFTVAGPVTSIKHNSITFIVQDGKWSSPLTDVDIFATGADVVPNLHVGYIRGFDFSLPNALNALGVEFKELSADEVKTTDLSKYTSIIVDNRVYESQPELIAANQKLLDYANAGGNLIVFYHKSDEWNPDPRRNRPQLAPYKLILGGERITDENAPISFIEPDHPLLNSPNKLNQDDFKDWIQERGLYYPREWDPQFHALLQSNDPGEPPLKGGLLVADCGRGHYIYTSMVWYRELRGGIPGAYRMLANMISYGSMK
jgi:LmbE family N-acetylglucosaminyl deacetylase